MRNLFLISLTMFVLACTHAVVAQPYSIKAYSFAGGGGSSASKIHALRGAVGQHDAFSHRGGVYSLAGGFWSVALAVSSDDRPALRIIPSGRFVIVAWPDPSTGFQLQQTVELSEPAWLDVSTAPTVVGNEKQVRIPLQFGTQFFRLQKSR